MQFVGRHPNADIRTKSGRSWLADTIPVEVLLDSTRWAKTKHPFRHFAHAILRDHLHWMLLPAEEVSYSEVVGAVKRDVSWRLKDAGLVGPFWQKRFYDHVIRDDDDFGRHLDYVHCNAVKHGYASRAADYRWSSFREWVKRGVFPEELGAIEPDWIEEMDLEQAPLGRLLPHRSGVLAAKGCPTCSFGQIRTPNVPS